MPRITSCVQFLIIFSLTLGINLPTVVRAQNILPPAPSGLISEEPLPPLDLQKAGRLERVAQVGGAVMDVAIQDDKAYISKGTRLVILDIAQPVKMTLAGASEELPDIIQGVAVAGQYVYLAAGGAGLRIFNVIKPDTPIQVGMVDTWANSITLYENGDKRYACLTDSDLRLVDVSDPENPLEIGLVSTVGYASHAIVIDNLAYVADGENGLLIVDISQPAQPVTLGSLALPGYSYSIAVRRDETSNKTYAYLANGSEGGLRIVDVSDPSLPLETAILLEEIDARDLTIAGHSLLAAGGEAGLLIFDLSRPEAPVFQARFHSDGYALGVASDGSSAYIADGSALLAVDLEDALNPKRISSHEVLGAAYRVALASQMVEGAERIYAYVADYYSGMYILDVTNQTQRPTVTGFYDSPGYSNSLSIFDPPKTKDTTTVMEQLAFTPGQRLILLAGAKNGVRLVDVSSPYFPGEMGVLEQEGVFDNPGLTAEIQTAGVQGQETPQDDRRMAYLAEGLNGGLRIMDLTDPHQPKMAGYFKVGEGVYGAAVVQVRFRLGDGGGLYTAAGETSSGVRYIAYLAAGTDGLRIVDVSDPKNPFEIGAVDTPVSARALAMRGENLFLVDGKGSGLHVYDIKNPSQPQEIGQYLSEGDAVNLAVQEERVILADGSAGVSVIDVSDPAKPIEMASIRLPGFTNAVAGWDDMIYSADRAAGLTVLHFVPARPMTYKATSTADQPDATAGDGICASLNGDCTLRAAVQEANANPGLDTIELPSGAYILTYTGAEEELVKSGDLDIRDSVYVRGAGAETTVIDGAGLERVFHVGGNRRLWVDVSGVTIQNGMGGINVLNAALFSLRDSIITRNHGYGIWGSQANLSIDHCLVSENSDVQFVGGIGSSNGSLQILRSSIIRNSGVDGGVYADGELTMFNSTISGNSAASGVGGLHLSGQAKIISTTIADNEGGLAGGLLVEGSSDVRLSHTIVADNRAPKSPDSSGEIRTLGYNLIGNPTGFVMERMPGDVVGLQVGLGPLTQRGALVYIHTLLPGSPALDGGDPAGCPGDEVSLDRKNTRTAIDGNLDGNPVCDIGAVEYDPSTESMK